MPRPRTKKTTEVTQDEVIISGSKAVIKTGITIGLSANYQSISIEAGLEYECSAEEAPSDGYRKAWAIVNQQVAEQMDDAKATLRSLSDIRSAVERSR